MKAIVGALLLVCRWKCKTCWHLGGHLLNSSVYNEMLGDWLVHVKGTLSCVLNSGTHQCYSWVPFLSLINLCQVGNFMPLRDFPRESSGASQGLSNLPSSPQVWSLEQDGCGLITYAVGLLGFPWKTVSQSNCRLCFAVSLVVSLHSPRLNSVSLLWSLPPL